MLVMLSQTSQRAHLRRCQVPGQEHSESRGGWRGRFPVPDENPATQIRSVPPPGHLCRSASSQRTRLSPEQRGQMCHKLPGCLFEMVQPDAGGFSLVVALERVEE